MRGFLLVPSCTGDLDGDGLISSTDLNIVLADFGEPGAGDINSDGVVDSLDLNIILMLFGTTCDAG
jgi:hypothetical protein